MISLGASSLLIFRPRLEVEVIKTMDVLIRSYIGLHKCGIKSARYQGCARLMSRELNSTRL